MPHTMQIEAWDATLCVTFIYSPEELPDTRSRNGDPPVYPGSPESVEIYSVSIVDARLSDFDLGVLTRRISKLSKKDARFLEKEILKEIKNQRED